MEGGGPLGAGAGQITGDSELAMCLMYGLIDGNRESKPECRVIDCDEIARYYSLWFHEEPKPFDIGEPIQNAFENLEVASTDLKAIFTKIEA